ncbi:hypothetical protein EYC80_000505 [Monilinia laxa]|uniref:Uncharacterized protein n=1 Tax=Monilinia laxa TaxID=61186 RepID=A0A5N6KB06_MONLA|nr:hypothetical protein EYC80_000505 [Monilinia laxa]
MHRSTGPIHSIYQTFPFSHCTIRACFLYLMLMLSCLQRSFKQRKSQKVHPAPPIVTLHKNHSEYVDKMILCHPSSHV